MGLLVGVGTTTPKFPYTDLYYGIKINLDNGGHCVADGKLERIGNLDLHRSLPIQKRIKRYVANADGTVNYWLGADDSRKKEGGGAANLNAIDGIIQLYKPDYYRRMELNLEERYLVVAISEVALPGFVKMSEKSRSPWLATYNREDNKPMCACFLTWEADQPKRDASGLLQFTSNAATFRGGNNSSTNDGKYNSLIGMPQSASSKSTIRTRCQSLGAMWHHGGWRFREEMSWLMAIEFGDLDSQAAYNPARTVDGYAQGGLGDGTFFAGGEWEKFNGYYPFIPGGITAPLGNNTGVVDYKCLQADGSFKVFKVASYRGWEQPQQYLWEHNDDVIVLNDTAKGETTLYLCQDASQFTTPDDNAPKVPAGYNELGLLPQADGYIGSMGVANGYSFPNAVGGSSNKGYCDYYYKPTKDGFYQLLSAASAYSTSGAGVRYAYANYRGADTHANCGFPLCLDIPGAQGI